VVVVKPLFFMFMECSVAALSAAITKTFATGLYTSVVFFPVGRFVIESGLRVSTTELCACDHSV
jgi:hypothetical protein